MTNILFYDSYGGSATATKSLAKRMQKLGYGVVFCKGEQVDSGRVHLKQQGKVGVIMYYACTCCPGTLNKLGGVAYNSVQPLCQTIPVIIVVGQGDCASASYRILGSVYVDDADEVFVAAVDRALKMFAEPARE